MVELLHMFSYQILNESESGKGLVKLTGSSMMRHSNDC
jgi:hypothetical protein